MADDEPELPFTYPDYPGSVDQLTSMEAADSIAPHVTRLARDVLDAIKREPATCWEIENRLRYSHQTASARIRELFLKGRIHDSGARRKTGSGRNAIVWAARAEAA